MKHTSGNGNVHNIFIDAAFNSQKKLAGIGLFDQKTKHKIIKPIFNVSSAYEAEEEGLLIALNYIKYNRLKRKCRIFTDNQNVKNNYQHLMEEYGVIEIIWIPRDINEEADKLSKKALKNIKVTEKITDIKFKKDNKINIKEEQTIVIKNEKTIISENLCDYMKKNYEFKKRKNLIKSLIKNKTEENLIDFYLNDKDIKIDPKYKLLMETEIENCLFYRLIISLFKKSELKNNFFTSPQKIKKLKLKNKSFEKIIKTNFN